MTSVPATPLGATPRRASPRPTPPPKTAHEPGSWHRSRSLTTVRGWLLSVVVFVAGAAAWALALPVNGTYDEKQHIVRAYAVATGRLGPVGTAVDTLGRRTEAFRAPRSLLPVGTSVDCTWWQPPRPASCQRFTTDRTEILMPTVAGHYSPTYYALVGWPLRISPDRTGVVAARLLSALLSGLLLGSALSLALRSGRRVLVAAVTAVATPTALNLAGASTPTAWRSRPAF